FFVVRARDAAGNVSDPGDDVELSGTSGGDDEAPRFSGCDNVVVRNAESFTMYWTPAVDDIASAAEITYNLYASTDPDGHDFSSPHNTIVGGSSGYVTGLEAGVPYYVVCRAMDPSGNEDDNVRTQFGTTKKDGVPPVFAGLTSVNNLNAESLDL